MKLSNAVVVVLLVTCGSAVADSVASDPKQTPDQPPVSLLFLGDDGHHRPADRFADLQAGLAGRPIELTYTQDLGALSEPTLARYDLLLIYGNMDTLSPGQEAALLGFVEGGGGLLAVHSASWCFRDSDRYVKMVGGQFHKHGHGVFRPRIVDAQHPAMRGVQSFETWDETYVHARLQPDNRVLMVREHRGRLEPCTWVRRQGRGRVFYTAIGHDRHAWGHPGFHRMIEQAAQWAAGRVSGLPRVTVAGERHPAAAPAGSQYRYPEPLSPEQSMRRMHMPEGFEVSLFASEPMVRNPMAMAFDERGRLWVTDSQDYPNRVEADGIGRDTLKILEDTNGDGLADQVTTFAEGLNIPTALVFGGGGVIVNSGPHIVLLKDSDGDDRADERTTLYSGIGVWDTHATASHFNYGHDNWIWGSVGYAGAKVQVGDSVKEMQQGFFRFKPDGSAFEVITGTSNNTWGLGFTAHGDPVGSTANLEHAWFTAIPNRYIESVRGLQVRGSVFNADHRRSHPVVWPPRQWDHAGGFTAAAGATVYAANQFPATYRNRAMLVCEPSIHLIHMNMLEQDGSHLVARDGYNLMASTDPWCAPVQTVVGPDGAVWFLDFYSYTVLHNKPDEPKDRHGRGNAWISDVRDNAYARIYRIDHESNPGHSINHLDKDQPFALVAALGHANMFWRLSAQRMLVEAGRKDMLPFLHRLVEDTGIDEDGMNVGAMHALWTMQGLGAFDAASQANLKVLETALSHPSAAVRRAALGVLPAAETSTRLLLSRGLLADTNASVRLAAILALSRMPADARAGHALFDLFAARANTHDRWIPTALSIASARHAVGYLAASLQRRDDQAAGADAMRETRLPFESDASGSPLVWRKVHPYGVVEFGIEQVEGRGAAGRVDVKTHTNAGWAASVAVKPFTDYELSGWIRTSGVAGGFGAILSIEELRTLHDEHMSSPLHGDHDWTRVSMRFSSAGYEQLTVRAGIGGWPTARGTGWFDGIMLTEIGPQSRRLESESVAIVSKHLAAGGDASAVRAVLERLPDAPLSIQGAVLEGLAAGWSEGLPLKLDAPGREALRRLAETIPPDRWDALLAVARRWGAEDVVASAAADAAIRMRIEVADPNRSEQARVESAKRLMRLDDGRASIEVIVDQMDLRQTAQLTVGLVAALGYSDDPMIGRQVVERWDAITPSARREVVQILLRRTAWVSALLDAVEAAQIRREDLAAEQLQQLRTHPDKALALRARELLDREAAGDPDRSKLVERLLPVIGAGGDATRGQAVFAAVCAQCHAIDGVGGKIGPDLRGIGARPLDQLLIDIIDPNRTVEANYRMWVLVTSDGRTLSGRLQSETGNGITLLDVAGQQHTVERKAIANLQVLPVSIMPAGFEHLPAEDLAGLLEYLSTK